MHLRRGKKYYFEVEQAKMADGSYGMDFFFTKDCIGGRKGVWADNPNYEARKLRDTSDPITQGRVYLDTTSVPKLFYYQSTKATCAGGVVLVHDQ
jgi:hypothetical protein